MRRDESAEPTETAMPRAGRRPMFVIIGGKGYDPRTVAKIEFTSEQKAAITTTGRSLIVSAAAGSGKTAVLAERCAYLVCDAPPPMGCDVNQLLVLTFTDAAAAEMRARIVSALRERGQDRPDNDRLAVQAALVPTASFSTIHAFCYWVLRRWFHELDLDPSATLLDSAEAALLRTEVLDALFSDLYERSEPETDRLLGAPATQDGSSRDALASAFTSIIDQYGQGEDFTLRRIVQTVHGFVGSLPNPSAWLEKAGSCAQEDHAHAVDTQISGLASELGAQIQWCDAHVERLMAQGPALRFYAEQLDSYRSALAQWQSTVAQGLGAPGPTASTQRRREAFETLRQTMVDYEAPKDRAPNKPNDAPEETIALIDAARDLRTKMQALLWKKRLWGRYVAFSPEERLADLAKTAPHARTIAQLVQAFDDAYAAAKQKTNVLDFSDLERFAYRLLTGDGGPDAVSTVAEELHELFSHVLVDEFQDVNPLQEAIIRLVSRETDPNRCDNLFVVGDIKQSIYRFRLAEPAIFSDRLRRFRDDDTPGLAIALQKNFRSRGEILNVVNGVFRELMRVGSGEITYDSLAELHPGRDVAGAATHAIEFHLLQSDPTTGSDEKGTHDETEPGVSDPADPTLWTPIEREALLISKRIQAWMSSGDDTLTGKPPAYRDVVILLRAASGKAEPMAGVLTMMDIPVLTETGGSMLESLEARDIEAVLEAIDNPRRDIPLAATLQNGVLGPPLTPDDLVAIRCFRKSVPFHEAVFACRHDCEDAGLRDRLAGLLDPLDEFRDAARRRPVSELIWSLYAYHGYLGYAGGLPDGRRRRRNLLHLHAIAKQFGRFQRQGVHRFLRHLSVLRDGNQTPPTGNASSENEDAVRIMSIHKSKGLEFPVVFLADLGAPFNRRDKSGDILHAPKAGIGLRVVDNTNLIEYPTCVHQCAADEHEQAAHAEELRILYVALTRARDKLIMVGSSHNPASHAQRFTTEPAGQPIPTLDIMTAGTRLDWILPALAASKETTVAVNPQPRDPANVHVFPHDAEEIRTWSIHPDEPEDAPPTPTPRKADAPALAAVARFDPLPSGEPIAATNPEVQGVLERMRFVYPFAAATCLRSAAGASELKDWLQADREEGMRTDPWDDNAFSNGGESAPGNMAASDAALEGVLTHRVLQHLDFSQATNRAGLDAELARMAGQALVSEREQEAVNADSLRWFIGTSLAQALRDAGDSYRREFRYISMEHAERIQPAAGPSGDDQVLVRGIVDGVLPTSSGLDIIDFKTDRVRCDQVDSRAAQYRPQMDAYARAMGKLWRRPVGVGRLVFLSAKTIVDIDYAQIAQAR